MSKIYYALVAISTVGIIYLVFFSGVFKVNQISVKGQRGVGQDTVKERIKEGLSKELVKDNIFLFDADSVGRRLKKEYALKNVKIKKSYPSKIDATIDEYVLEIEWLSQGKHFLIDEKGKVVAEVTQKKDNIPTVEDKKNLPVEVGKSMVTLDFIKFIKYINQHFSDVRGAKLSKIEINESFNEIIVYSDLGFYVIFDTTREPALEIKNLITATESPQLKGKRATYVDMRVKNKVFFK